jgi:hypothetical protein
MIHTPHWLQIIVFYFVGLLITCFLWYTHRKWEKMWDGSNEEHLYEDQPMWAVDDMTGKQITMDYMIGDLNGQSNHTPIQGDVVIFLYIDGMGMTVDRDVRGRVISSAVTHQGQEPWNPVYDSWQVKLDDDKLEAVKRYELRPCGLARRTWVVSR